MTISSSVSSSAGPKKCNRAPNTISPTITQGIKRLACLTVSMAYSPTPIFFIACSCPALVELCAHRPMDQNFFCGTRIASMLRKPDHNPLTLIVSWLDLAKRFTLSLNMIFDQSNLSN